MSNSKFRDETEEYSPREIKSLKRDLINQKNSYMNDLRMLKKRKEKESSSASTSRERKEITTKFSPKISALGDRIDRIREKIAILND
jgi:flagellar biosynthesis/type III secretory pathway chaperone